MIGNKELLLAGNKSFGAIYGQLLTAPSRQMLLSPPVRQGSVMIFNDGKWRAAAILDAIYRAGGTGFWGRRHCAVRLQRGVTWTNNANGNSCLSGQKSQTSFAQSQWLSDATLNGLWSKIYDTNTSRQNCNALMQCAGYVKRRHNWSPGSGVCPKNYFRWHGLRHSEYPASCAFCPMQTSSTAWTTR